MKNRVLGVACLLLATVSVQAQVRLLVPLYSFPGSAAQSGEDPGAYARIRDASSTAPVTVIVNPCDGPIDPMDPTSCPSPFYREEYQQHVLATDTLRAGAQTLRILGYIDSRRLAGEGADAAAVRRDIDTWQSAYSGPRRPDGLFFDVTSSGASGVSVYRSLCRYAKALGFDEVVLNPGTRFDPAYLADGDCDIAVAYEDYLVGGVEEWETYSVPPALSGFGPARLGVLLHDAAGDAAMRRAVEQAIARGFGLLYVTDDEQRPVPPSPMLQNPWNELADYWEAEVEQVGRAVAETPGPVTRDSDETGVRLLAPRPHPSSGIGSVVIEAAHAAYVQIDVYDTLGRRVAQVYEGLLQPGTTSFSWGRSVSPGLYHIVARTGGRQTSQRLVLR